jgi:methyl-accepting chemotaxis protein
MSLQDIAIGRKLGIGFGVQLLLIIFSILVGLIGIIIVANALINVGEVHAPVSHMSNEMKQAILAGRECMEELKGEVSVRGEVDMRALDENEKIYEQSVESFDLYANAILNGDTDIDGEKIIATENEQLARLVRQAEEMHNRDFKIAAGDLVKAARDEVEAQQVAAAAMLAMEQAFDQVVEAADEAESVVQSTIDRGKRSAGTAAALRELIDRDVPMIDVTMELKNVIAESRYILEEVGQATSEADVAGHRQESEEALARFNEILQAALNGGTVDNTRVEKTNDQQIINELTTVARHESDFREAGVQLLSAQSRLLASTAAAEDAMDKMDDAGEDLMALLDKVESLANQELAEAKESGRRARFSAILLLALVAVTAIASGLALGMVITRSITRPLANMQQAAEALALGEVDQSLEEVERRDEIGALAASFQRMIDYIKGVSDTADTVAAGDLRVEIESRSAKDVLSRSMQTMADKLRQMMAEIRDSSSEVASSADEISASANQIASGAQNQSSSSEETSSTMVEMASQIDNVAHSVQSLATNVDQTSSSIQEIGATIEQTARNADNLLSSVEETSSTIEQMTTSISAVADKVSGVEEVSKDAARVASEGGQKLSELINGIGSNSKNIGKIVKIIEDIADQTNLLALNAAIEAARAGEAGKGFAVVAEEVNRLAERSMKSTSEITSFVESMQTDTDQAVDISGKILSQIADSVGRTSSLVTEVYATTQEQSSGATQILRTTRHMQQITQELAAAAKQQATGARDITTAVEGMNQMTQQVADATMEQKRGGDQVVKAMEEIATVARQNSAATDQLSAATQRLAGQAERLQGLAGRFTVV